MSVNVHSAVTQENARRFCRAAGLFSAAIATLVIFGWYRNLDILIRAVPGLPAMAPNAAVSFLLLGVTLVFAQGGPLYSRTRILTAGLALASSAVGFITFFEHIFDVGVGIDRSILTGIGQPVQERMSLISAANFALTGCAAALLVLRAERLAFLREVLSFGAMLVTIVGLLDLAMDPTNSLTQVALHTTVLFFLISTALLFATPNHGTVRILFTSGLAGATARRLALAVFCVPVAGGFIAWQGMRSGHFGQWVAVAGMTTFTVTLLTVLGVWTVFLLHKSELAVMASNKEIEEARNLLNAVLQGTTELIGAVDRDLRFITFNGAYQNEFEKLFGVRVRRGWRWRTRSLTRVPKHRPCSGVGLMLLKGKKARRCSSSPIAPATSAFTKFITARL